MADLTADFSLNFDNYNLADIQYFTPTSRLPNSMPDIDLKTIQLVREHGSIVVGRRFTKKIIMAFGYILAPNRQLYEQTMDELKWRLSAAQRPLVIVQSGAERVYTATVTAVSDTFIEGGKTYIALTFECSDPFGRDTTKVVWNSGDFTTATKALDHVFEGFVDAEPVIKVTIAAFTGSGLRTVTIGNGITGQQISVSRTWTAGDVLTVDTENQRTLVNDVEVESTGFSPSFPPRTAYATYSDTFTTRTANVTIEYLKKYM